MVTCHISPIEAASFMVRADRSLALLEEEKEALSEEDRADNAACIWFAFKATQSIAIFEGRMTDAIVEVAEQDRQWKAAAWLLENRRQDLMDRYFEQDVQTRPTSSGVSIDLGRIRAIAAKDPMLADIDDINPDTVDDYELEAGCVMTATEHERSAGKPSSEYIMSKVRRTR